MNRFSVLRKLNPLVFLVIIIQVVTAVIFLFSPARFMGSFGGWPYYVHRFNGIFLVILVGIHLALNWGWVKANIFKV